jgi:hypothetical protein
MTPIGNGYGNGYGYGDGNGYGYGYGTVSSHRLRRCEPIGKKVD